MLESLAFPVALEAPEEVQVAGGRWFRRPEFHVTTFNPEDLAGATGIGAQRLCEIGEQLHDELTMARPIRFDGRVSIVEDPADGRRTLVAFCDVDGLEEIYARLSALAGQALPRPPTHVTLYTAQPEMKGIGLSTQADVDLKTVALPQRTRTTCSRGYASAQCYLHVRRSQRSPSRHHTRTRPHASRPQLPLRSRLRLRPR